MGLHNLSLIKGMVFLCAAAPLLSAATIPIAQQYAHAAEPAVRSIRFDDWYYRCVDADAGKGKSVRQCEVAQIAQVKAGEKGSNVLTLAIAKTAASGENPHSSTGLLLTALVPLNVILPVGLGLAADGKDVVTIAYRNCNQAGCWAQQALDGNMLDALRKGNAAEARLRLMNGQAINLRFSLKGLAKALAELQKPSRT
jgi:invasion protein IalB